MSMMLGARGVSAEMNVTPLVDVLLVLLIIFMITPRTDPHGLDTQVPRAADAPAKTKPPESTIVLQVLQGAPETATLRLNREQVAWEALAPRLREIYKQRANKVMFIRGDKDVEFSHVARALDLTRAADRDIAIGLLSQPLPGD